MRPRLPSVTHGRTYWVYGSCGRAGHGHVRSHSLVHGSCNDNRRRGDSTRQAVFDGAMTFYTRNRCDAAIRH